MRIQVISLRIVAFVLGVIIIVSLFGCNDVTTIDTEDISTSSFQCSDGAFFLQRDDVLYGWADKTVLSLPVLQKKVKLIATDVESFFLTSTNTGEKLLFVKKNDGSLWMCGYMQKTESREKFNFKELTRIMDNVVAFKADRSCLYVITSDNSLYYWRRGGALYKGKKRYGFIKRMSDVRSVVFGGGIDYAIKTDNSLWCLEVEDAVPEILDEDSEKFIYNSPYEQKTIKILDSVKAIKVEYPDFISTHAAYALDDSNNLWVWGNTFKE